MLTLILPHIAKLATVAVLCAVIVKFIVYPIFLSPLSKLPVAHPLAYVTSLWIQWHRWRGTEFDCVTQAFANQGSYVRLAPNEIAVNEIEAVRSVYGIGKNNFDKDPYYGHFGSHGIGIPILPKAHFQAVKEREDWALAKVSECEDAMHDSKGKIRDIASLPLGELPIIYAYMRSAMEKTAPVDGHFTLSSHQALEVASEILDHITATGDTFGTMFTYMVYELSRRQDIQKDLCEELLGIANPFLYNGITESSMPILADLEGLPCLESVIKESLRLRTQTPNLAPRVTPPNRRSSVGFLCNLPPGIRIGTYGWWLNRNPDVFPDPDTWEPRRWLGGGPDAAALRDQWLFAFGGGSLLRLLISGIYSNFKTTVLDEAEYPAS
ncbi:cytochrome P450 family protein [Akanthomyces lecanii RCEF 1005]|uniref:Cytochrome P450 family protein n=1 Tax=Akanthomyces lecanii RCEF 1005 TaxID=1081108 RepID=A0A168JJC6_CORDF|nr:cytochrome P450 family protein [Akanthomyces lecanii RCEF 1005]